LEGDLSAIPMSRRAFMGSGTYHRTPTVNIRMEFQRLLGYAFVGTAAFVLGCESNRISQYVSPRITGRVVDADTQQPLRNVQVQRVFGHKRGMDPPKGSQPLEKWNMTRTKADGEFVLESQRELTPFRHVGWYSTTLAFDLSGYESRTIEYSASDATNQPDGEPLISAGIITLEPLDK
jgi:hypothetical protein